MSPLTVQLIRRLNDLCDASARRSDVIELSVLQRASYRGLLGLIVTLCSTGHCLHAAEIAWEKPEQVALTRDELQAHDFVPLFDGTNLDQWNVRPGHSAHWTVRDGVIDYDGKAEQAKFLEKSLWTKDNFGSAQLYAEWRFSGTPKQKPQPIVLFNGDFLLDEAGHRIMRPALDAGDSGILFRGILDCQANIWCQELGSGEINGYRTNRKLSQRVRRSCIPILKADNPIGEWNGFLITLRDDRMTVVLNGKTVIQSEQLPDLPASGPVGLQHHGDPIQFRNIWVKRIEE